MSNVNGAWEMRVPRAPRYRSLDMWRGVACLAVVVYHSALYYLSVAKPQPASGFTDAVLGACSSLWQGVPLFFVISGYCITATADRSRRDDGTIGSYFARRFWRIYPPYWVVIALSILLVTAADLFLLPGLLSTEPRAQLRPWWFSWSQWAGNITLTETWRAHLFGSQRGHFVGQSWTLCYEEQFYFIVGLMLACAARRLFLAAGFITLIALAIQFLAECTGVTVVGFFFDGSWSMFAAGILVYYHLNYAVRMERLVSVGLLLCAVLLAMSGRMSMAPGSTSAFAFSLLLILLHPWDRAISNCRVLRPVLWCGTICYSLYLVHGLPVRIVQKALYTMGVSSAAGTLFVTIPLCIVVSVSAGYLFHAFIERHFLNTPGNQVVGRDGASGTACVAVDPACSTFSGGVAIQELEILTSGPHDPDQAVPAVSAPVVADLGPAMVP